eukprot:TRINITY_DN5473_c0_g3_i1.p1 TRINITY_DN5473_c0_g3~~TRINITY_DN5473_c0_g3_i1.p1  ORF type:complete len:435 (-),score=76.29 TRINITY_DN5473_c0_g3_i1:92-1366(-)
MASRMPNLPRSQGLRRLRRIGRRHLQTQKDVKMCKGEKGSTKVVTSKVEISGGRTQAAPTSSTPSTSASSANPKAQARAAAAASPLKTLAQQPTLPTKLGEQQRSDDKRDERTVARDAVKRALPRYARINTLLPDLTWGKVQRELQQTGHTLWRPSVQEKRAANGSTTGPEPPKGLGGKLYYRDAHIKDMLVFCPMGQSNTSGVEMFDQGGLIFQQKASAFPALALDPPKGATVIDACAAPGSKTSQLATLMENEGQIFAFDRDKRRLQLLDDLCKQRGVTCVEPRLQDFLKASPKDPKFSSVTHILLDPSCSSSGMTTQPLSDANSVRDLAKNQCAVIQHAMRFPAVERIAYSTCSIYEEENEQVVQRVLDSTEGRNFELVEALPWWSRRGHSDVFEGAERCVRTSWDDKTIGFFVALFQKRK